MVYLLGVDPPDVENEMTLLRDAFENEGFSADVCLFKPLFILWVSKRDGSTKFSVTFDTEAKFFSLRDPEDITLGLKFQGLAEAVSHGCDLFSIFPSWEMEKFPLLWEHLMEE